MFAGRRMWGAVPSKTENSWRRPMTLVGLCNGTDRWLTRPKRREEAERCYLAGVVSLKNDGEWLAKVRWASAFPWKRMQERTSGSAALRLHVILPRGPCSPPFPNAAEHTKM